MFLRDFENMVRSYLSLPALAILGPRQSGKTTFAKKVFAHYDYVNLEDPELRNFASEDPKQFLRTYTKNSGLIIDEFQNVPSLLSYLQLEIDNKKRPGFFILTGSQNFLMNQAITQSLAGRIAILHLQALSLSELKENSLLGASVSEFIWKGSYPRIYSDSIDPNTFYPSYIQTYVERDVRQLTNIGDLNTFQRFLKLCANRVGQILNISDLANASSISVTTARRWISILEASYIIFLLQPHFKNFNKRLTKSPKIYFNDTGLCCSLLGIEKDSSLPLNPIWGHLFENFIISDLNKQFYNQGKRPPLYFWRDMNGRVEVDCLIEHGQNLIPIEIKAGETVTSKFFDSLKNWNEISGNSSPSYLVYGGDKSETRTAANLVSWMDISHFVSKLEL